MRSQTFVVLCVSTLFVTGACAGGDQEDDNGTFASFGDGIDDVDTGAETSAGTGDTTTDSDTTTGTDTSTDTSTDTTSTSTGTDTTTDTTSTDTTTDSGGPPVDDMIDDFEDGDGAILPSGGRQGYWYVFNDGSAGGTQTPPANAVLPEAGGANGTGKAMHTSGSGFSEWGAGIGTDVNGEGGIKMTWDASQYSGIVLMARGSGQVRAVLQIEATVPPEEGGTCAANCDPHGKILVLSDSWQQFTIPFNQLTQEGWGTPASWDASTLVGIQFKVAANANFDFRVDEIGFY
ncbi:MAG: hypothetical protein KC457_01965 [Myxococcales bacterium]|nr:hypothetical protein [Myxococcales bacterium]